MNLSAVRRCQIEDAPTKFGLRVLGQGSRQLEWHARVLGRRPPGMMNSQAITFRNRQPPSHIGIKFRK